jgi:hypothetical protein
MPRRRRIAHRRRAGYTNEHVRALCGRDFFRALTSEPEQRAAWAELGPEIMAVWLRLNPGTRPDAWWHFDAPPGELRRCLNGVHPFDDPEHVAEARRIRAEYPTGLDLMETSCGKPRYIGRKQFELVYETQADYLERLGLMTTTERAALAATPEDQRADDYNWQTPILFDEPRRRPAPIVFESPTEEAGQCLSSLNGHSPAKEHDDHVRIDTHG